MLKNGCCGWSVKLDLSLLYDQLESDNFLTRFNTRINKSNLIQKESNKLLSNYLESSKHFCKPLNGNIGNLILTGVSRESFGGSSFDFFNWCLAHPGVGILPGEVFGISEIRKNFIPFRITTVHDSADNIVKALNLIESKLSSH
jgi:aspartate/methionine/tyrosine aminotransferase